MTQLYMDNMNGDVMLLLWLYAIFEYVICWHICVHNHSVVSTQAYFVVVLLCNCITHAARYDEEANFSYSPLSSFTCDHPTYTL